MPRSDGMKSERFSSMPLKERGRPAHIGPFQWAGRPHSLNIRPRPLNFPARPPMEAYDVFFHFHPPFELREEFFGLDHFRSTSTIFLL
jgi:hypothetical protein